MAATVVPLQPPPQYDVVPPVPVIEQVLSRDEIQKVCGALSHVTLGPGEYYRGCTQPRVMKDVGELRNPVQNQGASVSSAAPFRFITVCKVWRIDDELVRRHELAHCSGWPADHPGGK